MKAATVLVYAVILGTLLVANRARAQPPPARFITSPAYLAGPDPASVAVGDFNHDGAPDLVVASKPVSILLGNGDGSFQAPQSYAAGQDPSSVAVADFNGDGNPDIVVASGVSGTVSILLGKGDGTFQAAQDYPAGSGTQFVTVGDFNGDGVPDIAVVSVIGVSMAAVGRLSTLHRLPLRLQTDSIHPARFPMDCNSVDDPQQGLLVLLHQAPSPPQHTTSRRLDS
jgi:hypothetical protein